MSKQNPRDAQRLFASSKFRWLEQVARDDELPEIAARFCILLCPLFNLEYDSVAWPYQDTLATALGARRDVLNKAIRALVKRGHLTSQRRGRDKPNHYRFVLKGPDDVARDAHHEDHDVARDAHHNDYDVHQETLRCAPTATQTPSKTPGTASPSPGRESARPRPPAGARLKIVVGKELVVASAASVFGELCAIWARGWPGDDAPDRRAADRRAFEEAVRQASVESIFAGARAWFAAADAPRFLPVLATWLTGRCWEKPPPKKPPKRRGNGSKAGQDLTKLMLKQEAGYVEDDDGNLRPEGRVVQ
jgi:hypothetical protein